MLRAAYPFMVICILALAHVHIQFARIDMLMQQGQLQGQQRLLMREESVLKHKLAAMGGDTASMKNKARRLNMQELRNPTKDVIAKIPASVQAKYLAPLQPSDADVMIAELKNERQRGSLRAALMSLIDGGRAVASVRAGQP